MNTKTDQFLNKHLHAVGRQEGGIRKYAVSKIHKYGRVCMLIINSDRKKNKRTCLNLLYMWEAYMLPRIYKIPLIKAQNNITKP